jgi:hypothetical protein
MLFHRHSPKARFASWAFLCLLVLFAALTASTPAVGLAGTGAVLVLSSLLIEANKRLIWENYKKNYKKTKTALPVVWSKPNLLYYNLNVYVVWPLVFLLGLAAIYAAYLVA